MNAFFKNDYGCLKSVLTPNPPKEGFIICWISISLHLPSRNRYSEARPGGFRGGIEKVVH